ncbi:MAG: hypothetical protein R3345_08920 [Fulvivirga sp.]|nr:hypothetical protein [Fulvivirga sp.]
MKELSKLIMISLSLVWLIQPLQAQQDILDFSNLVFQMSNTNPGGSARITGLGGAQTALGGDISSVSSNPAGLGFFNRSEFSITPQFNFVNTSGMYLGTTSTDAKLNFNFGNLGVIFNKKNEDALANEFRGGSFGISINRIADYHSNILYQGENFFLFDDDGRMIPGQNPKDFIESAVINTEIDGSGNPIFFTDFAELAWDIGLIDIFEDPNTNELFVDRNIYTTDADGNLIPAFPEPEFPTFQQEAIESRGASYQTSFSYGGNYADRLYFGGSLGVVTTSREIERSYLEQPTDADLIRLSLTDFYELSGIGINATLGVIGRPINPLLIGLSYTTPTFNAMEQFQETTLFAEFSDGEFFEQTFVYEPFEFSVTTPSRLKAGVTYFFGKNGFITGDIERVNYNGGRLGSSGRTGFNFSDANRNIDRYDQVTNYRAGAEYRFGKFRLRGGLAYLEDPLNDNIDQSQLQVSGGAGFRTKNKYFDLAVISRLGQESLVSPYPGANLATITTDKTQVAFSIGWFF